MRQDVLALLDLPIRPVGMPRPEGGVVVFGLRDWNVFSNDVANCAALDAHRSLGLGHLELQVGNIGI